MKEFKFLQSQQYQTLNDEWYGLYVQVEDRDTGEVFNIPLTMSQQISYKGRAIYRCNETTRGERYTWGAWEYWIDNIYHTVDHTLIIECLVMIPNITGTGTYRRIKQILPYED